MSDRHSLVWAASKNTPFLPDLPSNITRHYIPTLEGPLELLSAQPPTSFEPRKKSILFQHGGFGSASVWISFLDFLSQKGYPCYAVSLRGHGGSWKPGYFRMVWMTGRATLARDITSAIAFIGGYEYGKRTANAPFRSEDLVLVGHSAGGGLCQYFMSKGLGDVGALVLIAAIPAFGGLGVYQNWFKLDPWFPPRFYIRDLWHPRSPLSSTTLVHRSFFSQAFPRSEVLKFERMLPAYESMLWPLSQMLPFANIGKIIRNVLGWKEDISKSRILVMAGGEDPLMDVPMMRKLSALYRVELRKAFPVTQAKFSEKEGNLEFQGVDFAVIENSGHHLQNDLHWEDAATKLLGFLNQL